MVLFTGDIIQFIARQQSDSRVFLNVDFRRYVDVGLGGNDYDDLGQDYRVGFALNVTVPVQATTTTLEEIELNNVTNNMDFFLEPAAQAGGRAGAPLALLACFTIKQIRRTKITRNGSKRISGVSESDTAGDAVTLPQGLADQAQDFFGQPLVGGGGAINDFLLEPVIVGRTLNVGTGVYELDLGRVNDVNGAIMATTVRSQVSRKL